MVSSERVTNDRRNYSLRNKNQQLNPQTNTISFACFMEWTGRRTCAAKNNKRLIACGPTACATFAIISSMRFDSTGYSVLNFHFHVQTNIQFALTQLTGIEQRTHITVFKVNECMFIFRLTYYEQCTTDHWNIFHFPFSIQWDLWEMMNLPRSVSITRLALTTRHEHAVGIFWIHWIKGK